MVNTYAIESARKVIEAHNAWDKSVPGTAEFLVAGYAYSDAAQGRAITLARIVAELHSELESGNASDGYHTHNELYEYRTLYHAHAVQSWLAQGHPVVKSWKHFDGEPCFGGGWFIVSAQLPTGQVSNHYPATDWDLFHIPEVDLAPEWDGHTPAEAAQRLRDALTNND